MKRSMKQTLGALASCVLLAATITSAGADPLRVHDGDTLIVEHKQRDLYGIDAPEPGTRCMIRGTERDCGKIARAALLDLTAGAVIVCEEQADGRSRGPMRCTAGGYDLSEGMLHTGWAFPADNAPKRLLKVSAEAREKARGLWASSLGSGRQ